MYKEKKKRGHTIFIIFIVILLVAIGLIYNFYQNALKPISVSDNEIIDVNIPSGSSSKYIGKLLEEKKLIKDKWIFLLKVRSLDTNSSLKAGDYKLNKSMSLDTIINSLIKGGKSGSTISFTIPEGYEIKDIAKKLDNEGIINSDKFLKLAMNKENFENEFEFLQEIDDGQSLEGFLFPSTYEIFESQNEEDIIKKMLEGFENIYRKEIKDELGNIDLDLNEIVTFASIIEREARMDNERPIMSGVLYNRLDIDMPLQVDATVQYAIKERKERLLYKDLEIESPYNTYKYKGLPPGPIASPGKESLIATINPSDVDYLFYVLKKGGNGEHIFTKTFEEHKKAK